VGPYVEPRKVAFFVGEQLLLFGAFFGTARAVAAGGPLVALAVAGALVTVALQAALYLADLYDWKVAWQDAPSAARLLRAIGAVTIVTGLALLAGRGGVGVRPIALAAGLGSAAVVALALRAALPELARTVPLRPRLYVIAEGRAGRRLLDEIARDGHFEVVGEARPDVPGLLGAVRARGAETVVVAVDDRRGLDVRALLECRLAGIEVLDAISFAERALKKIPVSLARPSDLVFSEGFERPGWLLLLRRLVSLLAALVLFMVALPLLVVTALAIKLDSPGPIFYAQERVGLGGRIFRMLKFRTMRTDAETAGRAVWAQKDDPRVTRVGKWLRRFRIDELPQIVNVLRGEMNLVGPRPERPQFVADLRTKIPYYDLRALVPPGITGWAQIRYPYAASLEEAQEKLQYDLYYVKHLSVLLDLFILFHTAKVVLFGRGAR
jgi:exopolysaccharide biosynthesis polyprenyl glycosylphosphotransferase